MRAQTACVIQSHTYVPKKSSATTFSIGRRRRTGRKKERGGDRKSVVPFILDLVFIQFGVALSNSTTRPDVCRRLRAQFSLNSGGGERKKRSELAKKFKKLWDKMC